MLHVLTENTMHLHSALCPGCKGRSHKALTLKTPALVAATCGTTTCSWLTKPTDYFLML